MKRITCTVTLPLLIWGCSSSQLREDETLKSLDNAQVIVEGDGSINTGREKAIEKYKEFLSTLPDYPLRAEAMRRLADLEIDSKTEEITRSVRRQQQAGQAKTPSYFYRNAEGKQIMKLPDGKEIEEPTDYKSSVKLYTGLLKAYPYYPGNDRVLYQLAKAYDHLGEQNKSLDTLNRLVKDYPNTEYISEAQFRRGELLFLFQRYGASEKAYAAVVARGSATVFYEKALFMQGWSLFKQEKYRQTADTMLPLLDRKLASGVDALGRGDRELLDDALRAVSLSFSYLGGAPSVKGYFVKHGRRHYEYLVYQSLGDLFIKQDRIRDAANVFAGFAKENPFHAQAPNFQLNVIRAYEYGKFPAKVLEAKADYVRLYGIDSEYWKRSDVEKQLALKKQVKTQLTDLSGYYHAEGQKKKSVAAYRQAARWYQVYIKSFAG